MSETGSVDIKANLFEDGFEVIGDFLHEPAGLGNVARLSAALPASRSVVYRLRASEINIMAPEIKKRPR